PGGRPNELIAPRRAALGFEDPCPLQEQEDLLQVPLWDVLASGDLLDGYQAFAVVDGEVEQGPNRVLTLRRNSHIRSRMECTDRVSRVTARRGRVSPGGDADSAGPAARRPGS